MMPGHDFDVLVVGGGPAGTTIASLLAVANRRVLLLEKQAHPRFHIGESLLPCNLPILEQLGVLEDVRRIGIRKPGADFTVSGSLTHSFSFSRALGGSPDHAFQVKRSEFDALLFDNCARLGVDARQQHTVRKVTSDAAGHRVEIEGPGASVYSISARFVVDASGREGLLAKSGGWRRRDPRHASAAVFGHFTHVTPNEGESSGNISIYWFDHGWLWMIPLRGGVTSVGAVCTPGYLRSRRGDLHDFLLRTVSSVSAAHARMADAQSAMPVQATGNYSYRSTRLYGDGFLLVGDAYAFVDPVFSSGVYLAMNGAKHAEKVVAAYLDDDRPRYRRACREYRSEVHRKLNAFTWFIYRFTTPAMRDLFESPRNDWQVEQAVIAMLAGNGDGSPQIRRRLWVFRVIYLGYWLRRLGTSLEFSRLRRRANRVDFEDETIVS